VDVCFRGQNFRYRPGHSLKLALPGVPVALACAFSIAEILYDFLCRRFDARLGRGNRRARSFALLRLQVFRENQAAGWTALACFGIAGIERGIAFGAFPEHLVPPSLVMRCSSQPLSAKIAFFALH